MFENKRVIIFDIDGTLLDTLGVWNETDARVIEMLGHKRHDKICVERETFLAQNIEGDTYFAYSHYLKERYPSSLTAKQIHAMRGEIATEYLIHHVDFKEKADLFIKKAKEMGFILAIASLTRKKDYLIYNNQNNNISSKCKMDEMFDVVVLKEDVEKIKPDPEIYLKVLSTLDVRSEECIVLEDSLSGVRAAKGAKLDVINMYDAAANVDREQITSLSDYCVGGFEELLVQLKEAKKV
ncbi:MAG: HAD-IA family hydrolase [Bacilli bacterium]|nr:HAD-IA family hydrolase [Bacilli bacterium]